MRTRKVKSRVFVSNLSVDATPEEIRTLFAAVARPLHVARHRAIGGKHEFALVEFADAGRAAQAVRAFDGLEFAGRQLSVKRARRRPSR